MSQINGVDEEAGKRIQKVMEAIGDLKYFCSYYNYKSHADRLTVILLDFLDFEITLRKKIQGSE